MRTAQVDLINNGSEPATYRISLVNQRMGEDGQFLPVDTPLAGELFANDMVQFSPRQVTLQPGTSQTVRVMVRKPAGLAAGEYRSHLHFEKMPEPRGATSVEPGANGKEIGIIADRAGRRLDSRHRAPRGRPGQRQPVAP